MVEGCCLSAAPFASFRHHSSFPSHFTHPNPNTTHMIDFQSPEDIQFACDTIREELEFKLEELYPPSA